jgi:hypothetical protein
MLTATEFACHAEPPKLGEIVVFTDNRSDGEHFGVRRSACRREWRVWIKGVELLPPHLHPEYQPSPEPAGRVPANWESLLH